MRIESWAGVTAVLLALFGSANRPAAAAVPPHPLPPNVEFPRDLERVIGRIYDRSSGFQGAVRADCR